MNQHFADRYQYFEHSPLNAYGPDGIKRLHDTRKKVCIIGAGLGKDEAPLGDPEWEVWALNLVPPIDKDRRLRADRWFDIHQRIAQTDDDMRWLAMCPFPLYVTPDLIDVSPRTVRYPLEEIEAQMGGYWACTFAYQIALILYEGVATDIGLYGVELAWGTARERTVEWACVAYWLGRAEERGIQIHLPENSTLGCHCGRYGFEYVEELEAVRDYTRSMQGVKPVNPFGIAQVDEVPAYEKTLASEAAAE